MKFAGLPLSSKPIVSHKPMYLYMVFLGKISHANLKFLHRQTPGGPWGHQNPPREGSATPRSAAFS